VNIELVLRLISRASRVARWRVIRRVKLFCVVTILVLTSVSPFFHANAQETQPKCFIRDMFSFESVYNLTTGFVKSLRYHIVEVELSDLNATTHNVTAVLTTNERLRFVDSLYPVMAPPTSPCRDGKITVTAMTSCQLCLLRIGLNETQKCVDPIDLLSLPYGQETHMLDKDSHLRLTFWFNTSEELGTCTFFFLPQNEAKIKHLDVYTDLQSDRIDYSYSGGASFSLNNITIGNRQITIDAVMSVAFGALNLEVTTRKSGLSIPIDCYLDGDRVVSKDIVSMSYPLDNIEFSMMEKPFYYYSGTSSYSLNFTAPKDFILRLDADSREEIDYLILDPLPENFSVIQTSFLDEPCYQFIFRASVPFRCCLGLTLKSKGWFISPTEMELVNIPTSIRSKYLTQEASFDGEYFDTSDPSVQKLARALKNNETNAYTIAFSIFQYVTRTLSYPPNWRDLEKTHAFNESVSQVLKDKAGVCRHFARTYAALCICSGLPARTVEGTAFNFLNEVWKKNHEWVEVYLPKCGWVTIDPTWSQFCLLSDEHAQYTYWNYLQDTLNVTSLDEQFSAGARNASKDLIANLIQYCKGMGVEPSKAEQVDLLFDKAGTLARDGLTQEALLNVAQAYSLVTNNPSSEGAIRMEPICISLIGLVFLVVGLILHSRKINESLLKNEEHLQVFTHEEKRSRRMEYNTLNELVKTRENSTTIVGSILSSASFLILSIAFGLSGQGRFIAIVSAVFVEGIWICYYEVARQLDDVSYDLLRKLEKRLGMEVHVYLERFREKSFLVKARSYIWFTVFVILWFSGISALI